MTALTSIYGLEYLVEGDPVRITRAVMERNTKKLETLLQQKALAPPSAADLATVIGRLNVLEAHLRPRAAQTFVLGTGSLGYSQLTSWRVDTMGGRYMGAGYSRLTGAATWTAAAVAIPANGDTPNFDIGVVPQAYWPMNPTVAVSSAAGRIATFVLETNGILRLTAVAPTSANAIGLNEQFSFAFTDYRLASPPEAF